MFKFNLKIGMILLAVLLVSIYFLYAKTGWQTKPALSPAQIKLQAELAKMGDRCLDFSERAVANDVPIVEFQMLLRLAKKTNVIEQCMTDNGYKQNPAWLTYARPVATINAAKNKISISEALTSLSRADMQLFAPVANRPDYWLKNQQKSN